MTDKYTIVKDIFDNQISHITLSDNSKSVGNGYVCKTPSKTMQDGFGFCADQVELADWLLKQKEIYAEKYLLFAVPENNENMVKIEFSHSFIGIPNDTNWILFETAFRARNRGGVKKFDNTNMGLQYVLKLYDLSLKVAQINNMKYNVYKYDFSATNMTFTDFAKKVMTNAQRIQLTNSR